MYLYSAAWVGGAGQKVAARMSEHCCSIADTLDFTALIASFQAQRLGSGWALGAQLLGDAR